MEHILPVRRTNTDRRWSNTQPQRLAAFQAALFGVCAGTVDGWTATAIPYLLQPDVPVPGITYREAAWFASLSHLGSLVGAIPAGYLANLLGRRRVILIMAVPMFLSWLMILWSQRSIPVLYTARFVQGFTCGVASVAYYMYCDEIAEARVRGGVGILLDLMLTVGMLYVYFCGANLSYIEMTIACTVLPVLFAVTFYWMPESPLYLLTKGQTEKAKNYLRWFRGVGTGQSAEIEAELSEMQSFINRPTDDKSISAFFRRVFEKPESVKDIRMLLVLMVFRQLCGIYAVLAYTVYVFETAGSTWDPYVCTAIFGVVQFVSTLFANVLFNLERKRNLPIISGAGMGVGLLAMLLHTLLNQGIKIKYLSWLPLIAVNLYIVSFSVGLGPVPLFMMLYRLSKRDRFWFISIAVCLNSGLAFLVTKLFPIMMNDFGPEATYGTLAVICLVGTVMVRR
jgi:SP family facilitated glucose transporter-like MFS transporter 8